MTDTKPVRIVMIDDHTLFREVLARTIAAQSGFHMVGEFSCVDDAVELLRRDPVDLVLLDINLGAEQGGSFLARARAVGYSGKVLVVTAGVGDREAAWLLNRGCSAIFLKNDPPAKLFELIRNIMSGNSHLDPVSVRAVVSQVENADQTWRKPLTPRQCEVLRFVCEGLANKEIAGRLGISENSVKSFLQQLFNKAGVRTRAQLVCVAIERYWDQLDE